MYIKCKQCGIEFEAASSRRIMCSRKCVGESQRTEPKQCRHCGKTFQPWKGSALAFCSEECNSSWRQTLAREIVCKGCGRTFLTNQFAQKFCSPECRVKAWRSGVRTKKQDIAAQTPRQPAEKRIVRNRGFGRRPCDQCGEMYAPCHSKQQFCGHACQHQAHSKAMRGVTNPNYQHGLAVNRYRRWFKKTLSPAFRRWIQNCVECDVTQNLVCHHIDEDKTHDDPRNIVVLCNSCHMKFHKSKKLELRESMTSRWMKIAALLLTE